MSLVLPARPAWTQHAACRGLGADLFYMNHWANDTPQVRHAKLICAGCPVRAQCLADNLDEQFGVWGGTTPLERRALRRGAA